MIKPKRGLAVKLYFTILDKLAWILIVCNGILCNANFYILKAEELRWRKCKKKIVGFEILYTQRRDEIKIKWLIINSTVR